jgi:hypothetical protein
MTDLQQLADRLEITDVLVRFHRAVDQADWDLMRRSVLAPTAVWDWTASDGEAVVGDSAEGRDAFIKWLSIAMTGSTVRHMTTSHLFEIAEDTARSESYMFVVDRMTLATLASGLVTAEHIRTADGWRITRLKIDERIADGSVAAMANLLGLSTASA